MEQLNSVRKTLRSTQGVLVNALLAQYEMHLWPLFEEHVPQPEEGSPRAILLCKDDQQARAIHAQFAQLAKAKDLTVDLIVEKGNKLQQRNDLFDGTEIIVGTTRRMAE
jgi:superfamily II DNA/RNA helicase